MPELTEMEAMRLLLNYTVRQVDIIVLKPSELKRYPTQPEMRLLIKRAEDFFDSKVLALLASKYDLALYDTDDAVKEPMREVSEEEINASEIEFIALMRQVVPDFQMPEPKVYADA